MKQKTAFQRVMAFLLSAVLMLSLCTAAFAAQPGRVETRALSLHEEFSIVVNYGYMENGNFVKTGSKTMVSTCCDKTGHSGYNHSMDAAKIVKESGYTYTDWRVTRHGYWDAPASTTLVHYTISGKAPYKADEAIWLIGEKPTENPGNPGGDGNGEGTDREETVRLGSSGKNHWMQTFVFHANYPGNRDPKATVKYDITAYTKIYNDKLKSFDACGFTLPDGYVLKTGDWYTKADGGSVFCRMDGNYTFDITNNGKVIHLYAQYTPIQAPENTFAMTYNANGGLVENKDSHTVTITTTNSSYSFHSFVAEREGYTFLGWYTAANGGEKIEWPYTLSVTGSETSVSKTVYAQWEPVTHEDATITYENGGGEGNPVTETVPGSQAYTVKAPEAVGITAPEGKMFSHWTIGSDVYVPGETFVPSDGSTNTFTAVWEKKPEASYTVTWYDTEGKTLNTETRTGIPGETVAVTEADKTLEGYLFDAENSQNVLETVLEDSGTELKLYFTEIVPDWENLHIEQTVDKTKVKPDDTVTYTIRVTNETGFDLTNITVSEKLDMRNLNSIKVSGEGKYADNVWTLDSLENGKTAILTMTAKVNGTAAVQTVIKNTAIITGAAAGEKTLPDGTERKAETEITVVLYSAPDWSKLSIEQTVDKTKARSEETVTYTIRVTNETGRDLTNITVFDKLDTYSLMRDSVSGDGKYADNVWTMDSLKDGETAKLTITAKVNGTVSASVIKNTAIITGAAADEETLPNDTEWKAETEITVDYTPAPKWNNLSISQKVNEATVEAGATVTFTIQVKNQTGRDLTNITVSDELDKNLQFISASGAGSYADGVWTIDSLKNGETAELIITANVNGTIMVKTIINTATITGAAAGEETLPEGKGAQAEMVITVTASWLRTGRNYALPQ